MQSMPIEKCTYFMLSLLNHTNSTKYQELLEMGFDCISDIL